MRIAFAPETDAELDAVLAFIDYITEGETTRCISTADITILPKEKEKEKKEPKPCRCHVRLYEGDEAYIPQLMGESHENDSSL